MPVKVKEGEVIVLPKDTIPVYIDIEPAHITDYCQSTVEVHGRPHTCARLNDHAGKHQAAVPQVGLVKW